MPLLEQFDPPGNVDDLSPAGRQTWSRTVHDVFGKFTAAHPQFVDPTQTDIPDDAAIRPVSWSAFPATQRLGTPEQRWARVDADRDLQDEYCEWSVARDDGGKVIRVTFTSETPEYYAHLLGADEDVALSLYDELAGDRPLRQDLLDDGGVYHAGNAFNARVDGPIVHLSQPSNTLEAAVRLAAEATVLREREGRPVTDQQDLVRCGALGDHRRHSDPQIAAAVNNLAAEGREITLAAPPGLYITGLITNGVKTPDGADPKRFWSVERGDARNIVRARFEVPPGHGYVAGDVMVGDRPLAFGGQLAERVGVGLKIVSYPAGHRPERRPCEA
ncbi:MAG: hypothetical protein ACR2IN_05000 [Thermoleophilaceae bacterium]